MFVLLRQRNFVPLWFAGLISTMGNWMLLVGLPIYTYTLTNSIAATSGTFLADQIPQILLGSFAGVFVDRWDRKRVLILTNFLLALGLLPLLFIHAAAQLWIVYLVTVIESIFSQFLTAESALLPRLVGEEQLVAANSLNSFSSNAARLVGPTLGGLVAVAFSLSGIALLDALTFIIAAFLTLLIVVPAQTQQSTAPGENAHPPRFKVWHEGLHVIRRERVLVGFFMVMSIAAFADGLFVVLFAPFVKTILHGNAADIGYLTSAQAVGGLLMPRIAKWKGVSPALLITLAGFILGANHLFLFNYSAFFPANMPAFLCFFGGGIATIGFFIQLTTLLQTSTPDAYQGRIFGMYSVVWALFLLLGTGLTGIVGDRVTILLPLNIEAGLFFPAATIAWLLLRPRAVASFAKLTDQQGLQMEKERGEGTHPGRRPRSHP
jgi:MFS family permease